MSSATLARIAGLSKEDRDYGLKFLVTDAIGEGDWEALRGLLLDFGFLQAKCATKWKGGAGFLMADLNAARRAEIPDAGLRSSIAELARVVELEQQNLENWDLDAEPAYCMQQLSNRAAALGLASLRERTSAYLKENRLAHLELAWCASSNARELVKTLVPPPCQLHSVRLSEDGRHAYTVGGDRFLRVWEIGSATQIRAIPMDVHRGRVRSLAVAKAGDLAVTGGRDHLACLWNLRTGGLAATLGGHEDWIADVAISPDGAVAATASYDHTVRLWDCRTYEAFQVLDSFGARVRSVAFTPDGRMLLVGDEKGTLRFFVPGTAAPAHQLSFEGLVIDRITLDPVGRIAALSCEPGMVLGMRDDLEREKPGLGFEFWEDEFRGGVSLMELHAVSLPEGEELRSFRLDDGGARSICFARGTDWLMAAQTDGRVRIYDFATGNPAGILGGHEKAATSVSFAAGANVAASAGNDGTVRLWDFTREFDSSAFRSHAASVSKAAVTADASVGVSVSVGAELRFWSLSSGELLERQDLNEGLDQEARLKSFAVASGGTFLAAANETSVLLYPFSKGGVSILDIALDDGDGVLSVELTSDGVAAGCVSVKGVVYLLDATTQQARRLVARDFTSKAVPVFSQNCIVTSYDDEPQVDLRDLNGGAVLFTMHPGPDVNVQTFELTPNGTAVFISYDGGAVQLWSIQNRNRICELAGSGANVLAISAIAGASRAAFADTDRKISLWNLKDRKLLAKASPIGRCFALAITRRADGILAGDTSGSVCFLRHIQFD